ncbi:MAG: HEPN domain-containing protein [Patescibacteria group bacterium]
MPNNSEKIYQGWFKKAEEDEAAARDIIEAAHFFSPACFHSQQMAEKYLKGLLIYHNKNFVKTHDLIQLEELLADIEPEIKKYEIEITTLNRYYIETRYPGDYPEFNLEEAQEAFKAAQRIKEFVLDKISAQSGSVPV